MGRLEEVSQKRSEWWCRTCVTTGGGIFVRSKWAVLRLILFGIVKKMFQIYNYIYIICILDHFDIVVSLFCFLLRKVVCIVGSVLAAVHVSCPIFLCDAFGKLAAVLGYVYVWLHRRQSREVLLKFSGTRKAHHQRVFISLLPMAYGLRLLDIWKLCLLLRVVLIDPLIIPLRTCP